MFRTNDTAGDELLATQIARFPERPEPIEPLPNPNKPKPFTVEIGSTGDFDEMLLELEDADDVFTDEMIFDFQIGKAFRLGC
jgi:hypothetical protein